jgi:hypothetical protein
MSKQKPTIGVERLLGWILENNLCFRFAESPRLRSLFSRVPSRNGLSHAAAAMTDRVRDDIVAKLRIAGRIVLVLDEWTDARGTGYLGMKIYACILQQFAHATHSLARLPIDGRDAATMSLAATGVLDKYKIVDDTKSVVSDTASGLPATVGRMGMKWFPCWADILGLMLK